MARDWATMQLIHKKHLGVRCTRLGSYATVSQEPSRRTWYENRQLCNWFTRTNLRVRVPRDWAAMQLFHKNHLGVRGMRLSRYATDSQWGSRRMWYETGPLCNWFKRTISAYVWHETGKLCNWFIWTIWAYIAKDWEDMQLIHKIHLGVRDTFFRSHWLNYIKIF